MTPKMRSFTEHTLEGKNPSEAYRAAGYSCDRMSVNAIAVEASRLLAHPNISLMLAERRAEVVERTGVTQDMVVAELARIGFANMADYAAWGSGGVTLKESTNLPVGASIAVAEVSETTTKEGGTVRFKLHDKKGALDSLAKHLGMFIERSEHNINLNWRFTIGKGYDDTLQNPTVPDKPIPLQGGE